MEVSLVVFWGGTLWVFKPQFSRTCLHDLSEETTSCYHMIVMSWHLNIYLVYTVVQNADGGQEEFFYLRTLIVPVCCVVYGCSSWSNLKQKQELFIVYLILMFTNRKKCEKLSTKCWEKEKFLQVLFSCAVKDVELVDWVPKTKVQHTCNHMTADERFHEPVLSEKTSTNKMNCRTHC